MRFADYQSEVKRRLTRDISSGDVDTYVRRWINISAKRLSLRKKWKCLRREETLTTAATTESYVLPPDYGRQGFYYHRALGYNYKLQPMPEYEFVKTGMIGTTEGIPYWYREYEGAGNVLAQPAAASVLSVKSSDSDDKSIAIRVEGVVGGYPDAETITTTAANGIIESDGSKEFTHIYRVTKSATTTGRITLEDDTDSTLVVLPVGLPSYTLRRKWIKLYYIPDDTYTIYAHYYSKIFDAVNDNDSYAFDEEFDEVIITGALIIGEKWEEAQENKAISTRSYYNGLIKELRRYDMGMSDDWLPLLKSMDRRSKIMSHRILNLGAYYPVVRY